MKITKPLIGVPCYFELATTDTACAIAFYSSLFGWTVAVDPRAEAGGYATILLDGDPVGGMLPIATPSQPVTWAMAIGTTNADATVEAVRAAGGSVIMEPADVLDIGRFAVVADTTGAAFIVWQGRTFPGSARLNEDGTLVWVELATHDTKAAEAFYTGVFGWTVTESQLGDGAAYTQWGRDGEDFGGMMAMGDQYPPGTPAHWLLYFGTPDVDASAAKAAGLGAKTLVPPMDIPGTGRFAVLADPQGAAFALYASAR